MSPQIPCESEILALTPAPYTIAASRELPDATPKVTKETAPTATLVASGVPSH